MARRGWWCALSALYRLDRALAMTNRFVHSYPPQCSSSGDSYKFNGWLGTRIWAMRLLLPAAVSSIATSYSRSSMLPRALAFLHPPQPTSTRPACFWFKKSWMRLLSQSDNLLLLATATDCYYVVCCSDDRTLELDGIPQIVALCSVQAAATEPNGRQRNTCFADQTDLDPSTYFGAGFRECDYELLKW